MVSRDAVRDLIDAAVLAERQSCAEAGTRMRVPAEPQLTYGQMRQQIEAEHPDDPRHYGAAKIARLQAEWKASPPWVRWAAVISDAICASSSVPLHYKHAVSDAMDALPIAVLASDERQS
jgi:hypothetical protein